MKAFETITVSWLERWLGPIHWRARGWMQFHGWTIGVIALVSFGNFISISQPFASGVTTSSRTILLSGSSVSREPASSAINAHLAIQQSNLAEISVGCAPLLTVRASLSVQQLRLHIEDCETEIRAVRNETNGFEATLFGVNQANKGARNVATKSDGISTDYVSLAPGTNMLVIDRTQSTQRISVERNVDASSAER